MRNSYNRHVVEKAWELFVSAGDTQGLEKVSPTIRDSWLRSKSLGVDPSLTHIPQVIPQERIEEFLSHNNLFAAGQKVVRSMLEVLEDPGIGVNLSDSAGRIIDSAIGSRIKDKGAEFNGVPGGGVGEEHIGTDSGTALYIKRPIQIRPGEHYCCSWQDWVTNATPLHDLFTQEVVGALSIEWPGERSHSSNVFTLLRWGRQILEHQLHFQQLLDRLHLLEQYNTYQLRFSFDALLVIDRQGHIIAANPPVTKLLRRSANTLVGCSITQALGLNPEDAWKGQPQELTLCLPQADTSLSAEILPVSRQGRETGEVIVLRAGHKALRGKAQSRLWQAQYTFSDLKGKNPHFQRTLERAQIAATTDLPLLLLGESGTGKELLAQAIHSASPRASGPFVPFNCGGVSEELIAAELFGYVEGAFTGAIREGRSGKVEVAHGGTLFLDEVDEMPAKMQVSLLRVLEDGIVVPVGSTQPRRVDMRLITATNKDLLHQVNQRAFRADLYYRLSGLVISLPALRERSDDLSLLAHHILRQAGLPITLTPEALAILQGYAWPGNIRELRNVLLRAGVLAQGPTITPHDLPPELASSNQRTRIHAALEPDPFARAERACILEALTRAQGTLSEAADSLGIHRVTLYRKMRRYGISARSKDS